MYILHGTWLPDQQRFVLWGEDTSITPRPRRGRRGKSTPHPFSMSLDDWLRHLDRYTTEAQPDGLEATLWLPGVKKYPCPSPEASPCM